MNRQTPDHLLKATGSRKRALATALCASALALALLVLFVRGVGAQAQQPLAPGAPAAGALTSRFGDVWSLYGCAGDVVTLTATSPRFSPYLELYAPGQENPMAEAGGDAPAAVLAGASLTQTALYTVAVLGERLSARGPYSLTATFAVTPTDSATQPDAPDGAIAVGQSVTGTVSDRFGDLWQVHLCAGAPVTVTMRATDFVPVLEPAQELGDMLAVTANLAGGEAGAGYWETVVFTPLVTLDVLMNVGGERRADRGAYTLSVDLAGPSELPTTSPGTGAPSLRPATRTAQPASQPTATRQPTATATPRPTASSASATPTCRVVAQTLRLRSGPGTQYEPPIASLPLDTTLELLGRSADAGWVNVRVASSGLAGWVSAAPQFVLCSTPINELAVVAAPAPPAAPPTNMPTNTPIPSPTSPVTVIQPTPTAPAFVIVPGNVPGGPVSGALKTGKGVAVSDDDPTTFARQIWLYADPVVDDGRAIDHVDFHLGSYDYTDASDFPIDQQAHTERTPLYCLFGGGEPDCNSLSLGAGAVWPSSGRPIVNGQYVINTDIFLEGDDPNNPSGQWSATIYIDSPDLPNASEVDNSGNTAPVEEAPAPAEPAPPAELPDLQVEAWEFGPGSLDGLISGQIAFQVAAWDPGVGENNGDGIDSVTLRIYGPNGLVHERTEGTAAYCAFGGGEPDCTIYDYAGNGYVWDSGAAVETGTHTLTADVVADDGRTAHGEWTVDIE